jgi:hypothetical protein
MKGNPIKATALLNEDEVVGIACEYVRQHGWNIVHRLKGNQSGIDIVAERSGRRLLIEAKGCTTGLSPDRKIHIQPHRTNASMAAKRSICSTEFPRSLLPFLTNTFFVRRSAKRKLDSDYSTLRASGSRSKASMSGMVEA